MALLLHKMLGYIAPSVTRHDHKLDIARLKVAWMQTFVLFVKCIEPLWAFGESQCAVDFGQILVFKHGINRTVAQQLHDCRRRALAQHLFGDAFL